VVYGAFPYILPTALHGHEAAVDLLLERLVLRVGSHDHIMDIGVGVMSP